MAAEERRVDPQPRRLRPLRRPGPLSGELEARAWAIDGRLLDVLEPLCRAEPAASFERVEAGAYVVTVRGTRRPSTVVWLIADAHAVTIEAFVLHVTAACPDPAPLHRFLLSRNLRLRHVHFGLDEVGDVFLTGSLPHSGIDAVTLDRVLGEVVARLEADQDALVRVAYGDAPTTDPALAAKLSTDGAGRRPAGTPQGAPRRDVRR